MNENNYTGEVIGMTVTYPYYAYPKTKKITTTYRKFDKRGNLVRETVVEEEVPYYDNSWFPGYTWNSNTILGANTIGNYYNSGTIRPGEESKEIDN